MDEEQFVLRLPPELAERMRLALSSKNKRETTADAPDAFSVRFLDSRNATFMLDGNQYPARLMDLPCVTETHKYTEKRTFYKSGDIGQVLTVRMPGEPAPVGTMLPDGLTPGSRGAAKRFATPEVPYAREDVSNIENTIKLIVDNKLTFKQKSKKPESGAGAASGANRNGKEEDEVEIVIEQPEAAAAEPVKKKKSSRRNRSLSLRLMPTIRKTYRLPCMRRCQRRHRLRPFQ
jgi:transcription initiation factor TFIID subunit 7